MPVKQTERDEIEQALGHPVSEATAENIAAVRAALRDNPITLKEQLGTWYRLTFYYPAKVWWLELKLSIMKFLGNKPNSR